VRRNGSLGTALITALLLTAGVLSACSEPEPEAEKKPGLGADTSKEVAKCEGDARLRSGLHPR
jgi:hypothetical protein